MSGGFYCRLKENNISLPLEFNEVALCCVNGLTSLLTFFLNAFVVYRFYQTRARQPVSNTLLLLLATLDLLKGSVGQTLFISVILSKFFGVLHCTLELATDIILSIFLGYAFLLMTIVMTSERFFAIIYPLYHRIYMRKKLLVYTSLLVFVLWALLMTIFSTIWYFHKIYYMHLSIVLFGLAYTLVVYVKIFCVSRNSMAQHTGISGSRDCCSLNNGSFTEEEDKEGCKLSMKDRKHGDGIKMDPRINSGIVISNNIDHNKKYKNDETASIENQNMPKKARNVKDVAQTFTLTAKEKKTIFRMLSIVGFLYLTSVPFIFTLSYEILQGHDQIFYKYLYPWAKTIYFVNGVINPYLYYYRNDHFRKRQPVSFTSPSVNASGNHAQYRYELPFSRNK